MPNFNFDELNEDSDIYSKVIRDALRDISLRRDRMIINQMFGSRPTSPTHGNTAMDSEEPKDSSLLDMEYDKQEGTWKFRK